MDSSKLSARLVLAPWLPPQVRRPAGHFVALLLLFGTLGAAAQDDPAEPDEPGVVPVSEPTDSEYDEPRWERMELRLHLERSRYDNFYRLPEDEVGEDTTADRASLRVLWSLFENRPYQLFVEAQQTRYTDQPSAEVFAGGFRLDGERHYVELRGEVSRDRPSNDLEDDPDPADVQRFGAEYDVQVARDWQVSTGAHLEDRTHDEPGRASQALDAGTALRWRGFGSLFSPELGVAWGRKNADRVNEEYTQRDLIARLRSRPLDPLYLSLRYRYRQRDYDVLNVRSSNFRREDTRDEWTMRVDWTLARFAIVNLEYVWMDGESTRPDKAFESSELALGVTLRHKYRAARGPRGSG
jgi:hypothetical protein